MVFHKWRGRLINTPVEKLQLSAWVTATVFSIGEGSSSYRRRS